MFIKMKKYLNTLKNKIILYKQIDKIYWDLISMFSPTLKTKKGIFSNTFYVEGLFASFTYSFRQTKDNKLTLSLTYQDKLTILVFDNICELKSFVYQSSIWFKNDYLEEFHFEFYKKFDIDFNISYDIINNKAIRHLYTNVWFSDEKSHKIHITFKFTKDVKVYGMTGFLSITVYNFNTKQNQTYNIEYYDKKDSPEYHKEKRLFIHNIKQILKLSYK